MGKGQQVYLKWALLERLREACSPHVLSHPGRKPSTTVVAHFLTKHSADIRKKTETNHVQIDGVRAPGSGEPWKLAYVQNHNDAYGYISFQFKPTDLGCPLQKAS